MIYLKYEQKNFNIVKARFKECYLEIFDRAMRRMEERGEEADKQTPIHHHMSPEGMAHEVDKKASRIVRLQSIASWSVKEKVLAKIIEECVDTINYAGFLGALCILLLNELRGDKKS